MKFIAKSAMSVDSCLAGYEAVADEVRMLGLCHNAFEIEIEERLNTIDKFLDQWLNGAEFLIEFDTDTNTATVVRRS